MPDQPHKHDEPQGAPEMPVDAGSQALSEALRSSFAIVRFVMIILVVVFFAKGFFIVNPGQRAIILRFGRPVGQGTKALLEPGRLHWSFPYPIDEVVFVSVTGVRKVTSTVGWFAVTPEQELAGNEPFPAASLNPAVDGYALTADGNIVHTRATLTYHIEDPISHELNFVNASNAVQRALDNALMYASARFNVDDILTRDITGFREAVRRRATDLVESQGLGVAVEQCDVESRPPLRLKEDFAKVLGAEITRSKVLNDARSYDNQVSSKASADAKAHINLAESDRARLVAEIGSRADQFEQLLPKYQENPSLFVQQRLLETLGRVMTNVQDKIFVAQSADGKTRELRLLLNREPPKPKTEETTK
jgi:membrane protease subunit HflK